MTAGKTNENENYYKRKNEKSGANHTYCANLPWHSNANITWLLVFGK